MISIFGSFSRGAIAAFAAAVALAPHSPAEAQTRSRAGIVLEDASTTGKATSSRRQAQPTSRDRNARSTPAPESAAPVEFVLGGRPPAASQARATTTTATLADTNTTKPATSAANALGEVPSLVDRLLALGESSGQTTGGMTARKNGIILTLRGPLPERDQVVLFGAPTRSLNSVLTLIRKIRDDRDISHVVIRIAGLSVGLADASELRSAITELRERDKKVIVLLEDESQVSYLIAVAADEVILPPSGGIELTGLRADAYFLKGLLAKIGMEAEFIHQGEYKSMGEMFERDSYSPAARRNMEELVDSLYAQMTAIIAEGRRMTPEQVRTVIDLGPATTSQALERGLVDRVEYSDVVLEEVRKQTTRLQTADEYNRQGRTSAADELGNPFSLLLGISRPGGNRREDPALARLPQVALVYANGNILQGGSEEGFEETDAVLSDDMLRTLDEVRKDRRIRAVLLRVNSPGGSAFASDLIWRKIREVDAEKPVVASMGSVAASGGYYIAMAARKVYATSGTLTGSIGVVGGKFSFAGTYQRLGITKESIRRGAFSDLFSDMRLFNPVERNLLDAQMREVYEDFLNKAARSRSMTRDQMHELAQGRVWSGAEAVSRGLVDSTEGLAGAINEVKRQIGVKPDDRIALVPYPRERNLLDLLTRMLSSSGGSGARIKSHPLLSPSTRAELSALWMIAPETLRQALSTVLLLPEMLKEERVLLLAPSAIYIH
jgi:protease-4